MSWPGAEMLEQDQDQGPENRSDDLEALEKSLPDDRPEPPQPEPPKPAETNPTIPPGVKPMQAIVPPTRLLLLDLSQRELQERAKLANCRDQLEVIDNTKQTSGGLTDEQAKKLKQINDQLDKDDPVDPFLLGVLPVLGDGLTAMHGLLPSQFVEQASLTLPEQRLAFVCGLLQLDNLTLATDPNFVSKVVEADGWYKQNQLLFNVAYSTFEKKFSVTLQSQVDKMMVDADIIGCINPDGKISVRLPPPKDAAPNSTDTVYVMSGRNVAAVVRKLAADGVSANDPWISSRLESAYNVLTGVVDGAPPSAQEIVLPDLEEAVDIDIVAENLNAVQAIYFSWQLEEMRLFQVVETIVDLFRKGLLPLGRSGVGDYLYNYYKKAAERITEGERRDFYMRIFGAPGGNPGNEPNRDFNELWLRFVSAVSSYARQLTVERLLRSAVPMGVSQEQVRKAGRDLGANLSRNGYGIAYFAATELTQTITEFRDTLQNAELRASFGAKDWVQVVDQVNVNYLGGARNTYRYRTQSRAGAVIIRWIANNVQRLSSINGAVLSVEQIVNAQLRAAMASNNPMVDPSDWDLVNACEQWLAVGGVQEQNVEQYAQPIESPTMTSRPIEIPQVARDVLGNMGISINGSGAPVGASLPSL